MRPIEVQDAASPAPPVGWRRFLRFLRSLVVGSVGSLVDFATLTAGIRLLELAPTSARLLGLVSGAVVMFFGSRSFAFRAQSGSARRQALLFIGSELLGLPINMLVFKLLLGAVSFVPPEALGLAANFIVFVTYYYPVRSLLVFSVPSAPSAVLPAPPSAVLPAAPGVALPGVALPGPPRPRLAER